MAGVVLPPDRFIGTKVGGESLAAPRHLARCHDGREGRDRLEDLRMMQGQGERAVAAHRVAADADGIALHREGSGDEFRQLARHVGVHPEVLRSEEHTSELQSLMRITYAVFCLTKKKNRNIY